MRGAESIRFSLIDILTFGFQLQLRKELYKKLLHQLTKIIQTRKLSLAFPHHVKRFGSLVLYFILFFPNMNKCQLYRQYF